MALHFTPQEFARRRQALVSAMQEANLDGMLIFKQESMFYLTGYDTFGYCFFQCLVVDAQGNYAILTRSADKRQVELTSIVSDLTIWKDAADAEPARDLLALVKDRGLAGKRLGVEYQAYGLTAALGKRLDAAFEGQAALEDASGLVDRLRVVKSEDELVYVRKAGELADLALDAAAAETRAGADEGVILGAMHNAIFSGGGDYPGNEFIIGSGDHALLCRYQSGRRILQARDQLTLEWAGAYRHYHAAMMRTWCIGESSARHRQLHEASVAALEATCASLVPGKTYGQAFAEHARVMDDFGLSEHRLNASGYSLGTTFTPTWMDWPMMYQDNPVEILPGMVIFAHMIIMDSASGTAMCYGHSVEVTAHGNAPLSHRPTDLLVF